MLNMTAWLDHVKTVQKANPGMKYSDVLKLASQSYQKPVQEKKVQEKKPKAEKAEVSQPQSQSQEIEGVVQFDTKGSSLVEDREAPKPKAKKPRSRVPKKDQQKLLETENRMLKLEALLKANKIDFE